MIPFYTGRIKIILPTGGNNGGGGACSEAPSNLQAFPMDTNMTLNWTEPVDPNILSYNIYIDGVLYTNTGSPTMSWFISGLSEFTTYDFYVTAVCASGESPASNTVTETTGGMVGGDITPPSDPTNLVDLGASEMEVTIGWDASTDDVAILEYNIYIDGVLTESTGLDQTTWQIMEGTINYFQTYDVYVTAVDTSGNESGPSNTITIQLLDPTDFNPPTDPTNFQITQIGESDIDFQWDPSTDDIAMQGYNIYLDGALFDTVGEFTNSYSISGLNPNQSYTIDISAVDTSGNESGFLSSTKTTSGAPTNLVGSNITDNSVDLSWDQNDVHSQEYYIYVDGGFLDTTGVPSGSYVLAGLDPNTTYNIEVTSLNIYGQETSPSNQITITTNP